MKIKRIDDLFEVWRPYWEWECYQAGMWGRRTNKAEACVVILSSKEKCLEAMRRAVRDYAKSAEHHLTKSTGTRPWLGQAACLIAVAATEDETRLAWNEMLNDEQRDAANAVADQVMAEWRNAEI